MRSEDEPPSLVDAYGWPQGLKVGATAADEAEVLGSLLDYVEQGELQLTHLARGQEHTVYISALEKLADRVVKITRPGGYGIIMETKPGARVIGWKRAIESLPAGRERTLAAVRLIENLGGPEPTLNALRIAAVRHMRGESGDLAASLEVHAAAAFGRRC